MLTLDLEHPSGNFQKQIGEVRSQGLEQEGKASLDMGINVAAAYTYRHKGTKIQHCGRTG